MVLGSKPEEEAKDRAFDWAVDYKPWEEGLSPQAYAQYGYEQGFLDGVAYEKEMNEGS